MQITAVIITFNEERNIERCINSLQGVVDEIIVVDSFSSDSTKEICQQFKNLKFYQKEWLGYSEQKNYANSLSINDFILSIDADEVLSEELKQNIIGIKLNYSDLNDSDTSFSFNRLTNYCGSWIKHCGWYPDRKIRIFHKSIKWIGAIHETLLLTQNAKIIFLKGDLLHYTVYSASDHIKQLDKFTTLMATQAFEKGKKATCFDLWFSPKWKFFRDYILKLGFLDGYSGYQVCKLSAFATFTKYVKLRELYK